MGYFYGGSSTLINKRSVTSDLFYIDTDIKGPPCACISFYSGPIPITNTERERKSDDEGKRNVPADEACEMDHIAIKQKSDATYNAKGLDILPDVVFISDL